MKLGRKGFMLAEVVVVAVVIATVLVTLYTGLNNVSSAYETRNRYYDVDSLYVAMEVNDILIRNNYLGINGNDVIRLRTKSVVMNFEQFYYQIVGDNVISYFIPYNAEGLLTLKNGYAAKTQTFIDYLDYLSDNLNFEDDYDYIIIVERRQNNDIDDCYYYALKLKY